MTFAASVYAQISGPLPMAWRWVDRVDRIPKGSPIVEGERVYIAVGARMYCIDKSSGNEIWRFPLGEPLPGQFVTGATISENVMVAATDDKRVFGVDKTSGELMWEYQADASVFCNPVSTDRYVVLGMVNNSIQVIDATTGAAVWAEPYKNGFSIYKNIKAWKGTVIFMSSDNSLTALDIRTQKPAWRPRQFSNLTSLSEIALFGDVLYLTSGSYLTALSAATGRARWEQRVVGTIIFEAAGGPDGVACTTTDGRLFSYSLAGRPTTQNGFDLRSQPVASPRFVGKNVAVPTSNGAINMLNPSSGEVLWNYTVPPLVVGMRIATSEGSGVGSSIGSGGITEKMLEERAEEIKYVLSAGAPVFAGNSVLMLVRDGSIVMFDRDLGVDLTPPDTKMYWPNSGDQVSGRPPMEIVMRATDDGSGVDYDAITVKINGKQYLHEIDKEDYIRVRISTVIKDNPPLSDGRAVIEVYTKDWLGNVKTSSFVLTIDNLLPPLGPAPSIDPRQNQGGKGGKGGGAGGGAGIGG